MENYFKDRWFFCLKWFSSKYNKMFHNYGNIWPLVLIFEVFTLRYLRFKLNDSPRTFCETDFFRFSKWHWAHFLWNGCYVHFSASYGLKHIKICVTRDWNVDRKRSNNCILTDFEKLLYRSQSFGQTVLLRTSFRNSTTKSLIHLKV